MLFCCSQCKHFSGDSDCMNFCPVKMNYRPICPGENAEEEEEKQAINDNSVRITLNEFYNKIMTKFQKNFNFIL